MSKKYNNYKLLIPQLMKEGKSYKEVIKLTNCSREIAYYYFRETGTVSKRNSDNKELSAGYYKGRVKTRNRKIVLEYLENHPCVDCGNTDIRVLEFDHVRGEKIDCISNAVRDAWIVEKLIEEIDKCEVRCANCHRIVTHERRKK